MPPLFLPSSPYKSKHALLLALSSVAIMGGLDLYSQFQYCGWIMRLPEQKELDEVIDFFSKLRICLFVYEV
jgi:hypothetical protein